MKFFKLLFLFSLFFVSNHVLAANLSLDTDINNIKINGIFTNTLYLNTDGQSINAVEGDLNYDINFVSIEKINIGNSSINFWVEKPNIKTPGSIHFSGIIPGGLYSNKSELFSLIFRAEKEGNTQISLNNVNLFLNDGQGSKISVKSSDIVIKIVKDGNDNSSLLVSKDTISPETFSIIRTRDQSIYNNKYFVVFNTQDKGS
jgi:hypothetical protein